MLNLEEETGQGCFCEETSLVELSLHLHIQAGRECTDVLTGSTTGLCWAERKYMHGSTCCTSWNADWRTPLTSKRQNLHSQVTRSVGERLAHGESFLPAVRTEQTALLSLETVQRLQRSRRSCWSLSRKVSMVLL